ncbi:MAG: LPS export ABC transporter periplasmic protein LptC [Paracoccaceae bacterium]|uniref:LPS export ABC transporter periplasmic protein LptC n=1 Tax=Seohaeicola saemankumensis TaxID=481181 RepID=UPI001E34AF91|nr:LPS export ABC transporter periplasmic protein LptC [Seohaeicola saemankumensis]MCD1624913.1 LPS export ABC transporter periplasmic protein LptC [Seohaeicola saemankumensis]
MAQRDDLRSRIINWLKILLPLAALGLLSTVFLLSRTLDPTNSIPTSRADLESRTGNQQISSPSFAGKTDEGHLVAFVATKASVDPDQSDRVIADTMAAQIDMVDGGRINITSDTGTVEDLAGLAILEGDVVLTSSTGYRIETELLTTRMREIAAESGGAITGNGPPGQIDAGKMTMTSDAQTGDIHLLFTNGVKLIYDPSN